MIATDITRGKMIVLPDDIADYGMDPQALPVSLATRGSMSIPGFFEALELYHPECGKCRIVDGGVVSNFPLHLFTDGPELFGFRFVDPQDKMTHHTNTLLEQFFAMFDTMRSARDNWDAGSGRQASIIDIPTLGISAVDFRLTKDEVSRLYQSGRDAVDRFFEKK